MLAEDFGVADKPLPETLDQLRELDDADRAGSGGGGRGGGLGARPATPIVLCMVRRPTSVTQH